MAREPTGSAVCTYSAITATRTSRLRLSSGAFDITVFYTAAPLYTAARSLAVGGTLAGATRSAPDARRRPTLAREAYSLYVERASEGAALPQMGLFQPPAHPTRGSEQKEERHGVCWTERFRRQGTGHHLPGSDVGPGQRPGAP